MKKLWTMTWNMHLRVFQPEVPGSWGIPAPAPMLLVKGLTAHFQTVILSEKDPSKEVQLLAAWNFDQAERKWVGTDSICYRGLELRKKDFIFIGLKTKSLTVNIGLYAMHGVTCELLLLTRWGQSLNTASKILLKSRWRPSLEAQYAQLYIV